MRALLGSLPLSNPLALTALTLLGLASCSSTKVPHADKPASYQGRPLTGVTEYYQPGAPRPSAPDSIAALASGSSSKPHLLPRSQRKSLAATRKPVATAPAPAPHPDRSPYEQRPSFFKRLVASVLPTTPAEQSFSGGPPVFANPDGTTSRVIGNTLERSDGTHGDMIGNTIYYPDGSTARIVGNAIHNPDGSSSRRVN